MTRGATRSIAVLAAAALVALLLAACGSSDSGSSGSGSSTSETSAQDNGSGGGTHGENDAGSEGKQQGGSANGSGGSGSGSGKDSGSTGFTAAEVEVPLKVSGGGSEQFIVKGGDNSIQEYGEEKDESELQEAAEAVHGFFVARAIGDWEKACGYLSKAMTEQLEQLAASSTTLKDKGCASFLEAFTTELSAASWRQLTTVDAGSLRQKDEQAFLIYRGAEGSVYAMPLSVEDGEFKVGALAGNAIDGG